MAALGSFRRCCRFWTEIGRRREFEKGEQDELRTRGNFLPELIVFVVLGRERGRKGPPFVCTETLTTFDFIWRQLEIEVTLSPICLLHFETHLSTTFAGALGARPLLGRGRFHQSSSPLAADPFPCTDSLKLISSLSSPSTSRHNSARHFCLRAPEFN